jgi:hypothetical protein
VDTLAHLRRRAPFLFLGLISLLAGLWAGLLRLGFDLPELRPELAADHGPLMALGFLGTLISLERAVALTRKWGYLSPLCFGLGMLATLMGWQVVGGWLLIAGGALFVAIFIAVLRIQLAFHGVIMGLGAVASVVAAAFWLDGRPPLVMASWLAGFLVLTICGERLELARFVQLLPIPRFLFLAATAVFGAGLIITIEDAPVGTRILGAGLILLAAWLARYDIARRTIRSKGLTRFMAACLLAGYAWLALAGVVWMVSTDAYGWSYDAKLHAVFLGFAMSMIFGHAAVIFPSVFRIAVPYHRIYWLHLALLHVGLAIRLLGDAYEEQWAWQLGGVLNETAILLFIGVTIVASVRATRSRSAVSRARLAERQAAG